MQPQVTEANWKDEAGKIKKITGLNSIENYISAKIPYFGNQTVGIYLFVNGKKITQQPFVTKTDKDGNVNYQLKLNDSYKKHLLLEDNENSCLQFQIEGIVNSKLYTFKKPVYDVNNSIIEVSAKQQITNAYFIYNGKKVTESDKVPYGAKVKAVVETLNMIGKKVSINIYRKTMVKDYSIDDDTAIVTKNGKATREFVLKVDWYESSLLGKDSFYIGTEEVHGINFIRGDKYFENNLLKATDKGEVEEEIIGIKKERAPWMDLVVKEAVKASGKKEWVYPLSEMVEKYHEYTGAKAKSSVAWCASFVSWAIGTSNIKGPKTKASRLFINHTSLKKIEKSVFGAIAVFSDCNKTGSKIFSSGHVAFVYGKISGETYALLGGNQGDRLKVSKYDCSGNAFFSYKDKNNKSHYKIFRGFYVPKDFELNDIDKLTASDVYKSAKDANKKLLNTTIKESKNGESSR
ncbi:C40 family peptidase [Tenacibaculum ovolyticum]|uniref:hypothetical protein n=1 Tax=Tenacibaculum ovolyticum TaxID=104270 RepID=UPI0003FCC738|nr:hypothetical protein [Tenacibaculum ovolyticum]